MAEARNGQHTSGHSFAWSISPVAANPLLAVATDINGRLLEHVAGAQKDWADFVHRRFKEDLAASRQLMNCQSFGDVQQVYSQYLRTAAEQCREQSEKALQRGQSMARELPWPALRPNGDRGGDAALGE